jgi:hypothetical protein
MTSQYIITPTPHATLTIVEINPNICVRNSNLGHNHMKQALLKHYTGCCISYLFPLNAFHLNAFHAFKAQGNNAQITNMTRVSGIVAAQYIQKSSDTFHCPSSSWKKGVLKMV